MENFDTKGLSIEGETSPIVSNQLEGLSLLDKEILDVKNNILALEKDLATAQSKEETLAVIIFQRDLDGAIKEKERLLAIKFNNAVKPFKNNDEKKLSNNPLLGPWDDPMYWNGRDENTGSSEQGKYGMGR